MITVIIFVVVVFVFVHGCCPCAPLILNDKSFILRLFNFYELHHAALHFGTKYQDPKSSNYLTREIGLLDDIHLQR